MDVVREGWRCAEVEMGLTTRRLGRHQGDHLASGAEGFRRCLGNTRNGRAVGKAAAGIGDECPAGRPPV